MKRRMLYMIAAVALVGGIGHAETIVLRDGTTRQGTIQSRNGVQLQLLLKGDGIRGTIVIPLEQVVLITQDEAVPETRPAGSSGLLAEREKTEPAASRPATTLPADAFAPRGFFVEMAADFVGKGEDDPQLLPAPVRELWDQAVLLDIAGKRPETLDALHRLEAQVHDVPGALGRLEAVARRVRDNEGFGAWMGRVHWDVILAKYKTGQFDLSDVRDVERPTLVGMLRAKTGAALEPLKAYFPPADMKTGSPAPFKPAQLQGITVSNALEVKDKASYAAAVLLAQLKVEPTMPAVDRQLLASELASVNRILSKARELEPAARAAQAKAQRDQRMAEENARRNSALIRQRATVNSQ